MQDKIWDAALRPKLNICDNELDIASKMLHWVRKRITRCRNISLDEDAHNSVTRFEKSKAMYFR